MNWIQIIKIVVKAVTILPTIVSEVKKLKAEFKAEQAKEQE